LCREQLGGRHVVEGEHVLEVAAHMNDSIKEIERLLREVADHLRAGTPADARKAVAKLERIAALASTLALTVKAARR
jgi:hypothetical protein